MKLLVDKYASLYRGTPLTRTPPQGDEGWSLLAEDPTSPVKYVHCTENAIGDKMWSNKSIFLVPLPMTNGTPSMFIRNAVDGRERSICKSKRDFVQAFVNPPTFKNITYRDPIVIVEGVKDAEAVRVLGQYPYVLAVMTSSIKTIFAQFLRFTTRKVVFIFDADDAGERGTRRSAFKCKKEKLPSDSINLPKGVKDVGEILIEKPQYQNWLRSVILGKVRS